MNVKVTCCIFQKYGKPVLPFMNVWYFLAKNIFKSSPKVGNRASVGFSFQEEPQAKQIRILYDLSNSQRAFEATQLIIKNRQKSKF